MTYVAPPLNAIDFQLVPYSPPSLTAINITYNIIVVAPPTITLQSFSVNRISSIAGVNVCSVSFTSNQNLLEWEARADGNGHGSGTLVGNGTNLSAGQTGHFEVWYNELLAGDKIYQINIYGRNANNQWTPHG